MKRIEILLCKTAHRQEEYRHRGCGTSAMCPVTACVTTELHPKPQTVMGPDVKPILSILDHILGNIWTSSSENLEAVRILALANEMGHIHRLPGAGRAIGRAGRVKTRPPARCGTHSTPHRLFPVATTYYYYYYY